MASTTEQLVNLFTDTMVTHNSGGVPSRLINIAVKRFVALEVIASDIQALNDIQSLTGRSLELRAEKWQIFRQGKSDAELLDALLDRIFLFFSGSTISDFIAVLVAFDAPPGSKIVENLPPEDAEVNVFINGATQEVFDRILRSLNVIRGAAIEIDGINALVTIGDKLLTEDGNFLLHEDGDKILLE